MKPLYYLLQVIVASGILYGYYHLALRNKKFHRYNRFYLLSAVLISILIPFLNIPVYFTPEETASSPVLRTLTTISSGHSVRLTSDPSSSYPVSSTSNWFTWTHITYLFYFLIGITVLLRVVYSLRKIRAIARMNPVEKLDDIRFVNTNEPGTPFSFFRWLFWNRKIELGSTKGEQIFRHEYFHIREKHSLDIISMELLMVVFWINPFFHLIKREIKAIHEFLADRFAVKENDRWEYAELLLMQALNTQSHLVNPFFHNQIKRRIAMITSSSKPGHQYLRKVLVLPIAALVVALFAFSYKNKKEKQSITIEGNVKRLPNGKIYLAEAHHWQVLLDSAMVTDGHFSFTIKTDDSFVPYMASLEFPDHNSWSGLGQLMFTNEFAPAAEKSDPRSTSGFYLEKGVTEITDNNSQQVWEVPSGASFIPVNIKAGKETEIMFRYEQTPSDIKTLVRQYPFSFFLLQTIYEERGRYSTNELKDLLSLFDNDVQSSKLGEQVRTYIANGPKPGERAPYRIINDTLKPLIIEGPITSQKPVFSPAPNGKWDKYKKTSVTSDKVDLVMNNGSTLSMQHVDFNVFQLDDRDTSTHPLQNILYVIDGAEYNDITSFKDLDSKLKASDIRSINIWKDKVAIAKFGEKGRNGVIEIFTKRSKPDDIEIREVTLEDIKQDESVFEKVEIDPMFPGGESKWKEYLQTKVDETTPVKQGAPSGVYTVILQFMVDTKGDVHDIKALTHFGYSMEEQVINAIKNGPKWLPSIQNGQKVNAYKRQSVTFVVVQKQMPEKDSWSAAVSVPNNMDILFMGVDTPITITSSEKKDNLIVSISQGSITGSNGKYTARVVKEGEAVITVTSSTGKSAATFHFKVKRADPPGEHPRLYITLLGNPPADGKGTIDFKLQFMPTLVPYELISCNVTITNDGEETKTFPIKGGSQLPEELRKMAVSYKKTSTVVFNDINAKAGEKDLKLPSQTYTLKKWVDRS